MTTQTPTSRVTITGASTSYVPEAFTLLGVTRDAQPNTACASCPSGIWFKQAEWHCFCNVMKFQP